MTITDSTINQTITSEPVVLPEETGPELEWCPNCALDDDPATEAGMPRVVVDRTIETDLSWDTTLGHDPEYAVTYLACGHTLAELC